MKKWSKTRNKLETEYLAESLKGHIQYYVTTYKKSHDREGRASIRFDGKEILQGNYYNQWNKSNLIPKDGKYEERMMFDNPFVDDTALELGLFDQRNFYSAFDEFDNQSIERSLSSENLLVKIFALLDRRTGKRRLKNLKLTIHSESPVIQMLYQIRTNAERI